MRFFDGLWHFLTTFGRILGESGARRLYFRQLFRAFVFGVMFWLLTVCLVGTLLWFLFRHNQEWIPWLWLEAVTGVGFVLVWLVVTYFTTGPITLLLVGIYLSQVTPWKEMEEEFKMDLPPIQEPAFFRALSLNLVRTLLLVIVIVFGAFLSLIPPLFLVTPFITGYALGKDWVWTARDLFRVRTKLEDSDWAYCIGLGIIPSLFSSMPFLGILCLPILQAASLIPYEEKTRID
jgi:uncharacterized protein involved in cysteine biosynthesis